MLAGARWAFLIAVAFLWLPDVRGEIRILSATEQKAVLGGSDCSNTNGKGSVQASGNGNNSSDDPIDIRNGNLFYDFTDFSYPTRGSGSIALARRYNAQVFSELAHWQPEVRSGSWAIQNGVYNGQGDRSVSNTTFGDAVIEMDVLTVEPGNEVYETAWINFRFTDPDNRYYVAIHQNGKVELSKVVNGTFVNLAENGLGYVDPLVWNHVRIETSGGSIKVFINGAPFFDVTDSSLSSGQVALEAYFSQCQFDNVAITDTATPSNSISDDFDVVDNDGPFGNQWTHSYGVHLWERANGDVVVERGSGQRDVFVKNGSTYTAPALVYDTLVKSAGVNYTLTTKHGIVWTFATDGTLSSIQDRNNNTTTLAYSNVNATIAPFAKAGRNLLVDEFADSINYNSLNRWTDDDGTLSKSLVGEALQLNWSNTSAYWYTVLYSGSLRADVSAYTHLSIDLKGLAGGENFGIQLQTDGGNVILPLSNYATLGTSFQTVQIPLADFANAGADLATAKAVALIFNSTASGTVQADNIWFVANTTAHSPVTYTVKRLSTVTDPSGRQTTFTYGANGKVSQIVNPANRTFTYAYDADGNLTSSTDSRGFSRLFEYNPNRTLKKYTDRSGNVFEFTYTYNNRCITQKDPLGKITTYDYLWSFTEVRNNNGDKWTYQFDPATNQLLAITDPLGNVESWVVNATTGEFTEYVDRNGHTISRAFDSKGNMVSMTDPLNKTTTFTYDPNIRELTSVTDALGHTTTFSYDSGGNLVQITDANGKLTTFTYDTTGNRLTATNPLGKTATYVYNGHGDLLSRTDSLGNKWEYTYNGVSEVLSVKEPRGNSTQIARDAGGLITSVTTPLGHTTSFEYDSNGNRKKTIQPGNLVTEYVFNGLNKVIKTIDPVGNETQFVYDTKNFMQLGQNLLTQLQDANNHSAYLLYDALGRVVSETDARGAVTQYTYDALGLLKTVKDPNNNVTTYSYDAANRVISIIYPDSSVHAMDYDAVGNLISETTRKGDEIDYQYDVLNRCTKKIYPNGQEIIYSYNDIGQLTQVQDVYGANPTTFTYDGSARLLSVTNPWGKTVSYEYDTASNRTKLTYPDGSELTYQYDADNRLTQIHDVAANENYTFNYDTNARRTLLTYPNGVTANYTYDNAHRLTSLVNKDPSNQVLSQYVYTVNGIGSRTTRTTTAGTDVYTYDNSNQLTEVSYSGGSRVVTYHYDASGNRSSVVDGTTISYSVNNLNQYTSVGGVAHVYDANGSLTDDGVRSMVYDVDNRVRQVTKGSDQAAYAYDFAGRRISQTVNNVETSFLYDGIHAIADQNDNGDIVRKYIYGTGTDEVLALKSSSATYYLTRDGVNSVSEATNNSGQKIESYSYEVYGKVTVYDGNGTPITASAINNRFLFTGREWDKDTGLYFYRARHYSPDLGRFLQPDPITFKGGSVNLYAYVLNDPVNFWDSLGLQSAQIHQVTGQDVPSWSFKVPSAGPYGQPPVGKPFPGGATGSLTPPNPTTTATSTVSVTSPISGIRACNTVAPVNPGDPPAGGAIVVQLTGGTPGQSYNVGVTIHTQGTASVTDGLDPSATAGVTVTVTTGDSHTPLSGAGGHAGAGQLTGRYDDGFDPPPVTTTVTVTAGPGGTAHVATVQPSVTTSGRGASASFSGTVTVGPVTPAP